MTDSRSAADVQISLLGGFAVTVSGESVEDHWRLRKAKTLVNCSRWHRASAAPRHRAGEAVARHRAGGGSQ